MGPIRIFDSDINLPALSAVAGNIRKAVVVGEMDVLSRAELAVLAVALEDAHVRAARRTGEVQSVLTTLTALCAALAAIMLKAYDGHGEREQGYALAGVLAALAVVFGVGLSYAKGWEAVVVRVGKAYDELQKLATSKPAEGVASEVEVAE